MSRIIANSIRHNDATADSLSFDSSARVGIGTSSPAVTVHAEAAQAELQLKSTSGTNSAGLRFVPGGQTNALYIYADGSRNINIDNHATSIASFRAGGGLTFNGDTAAANALNDYEEGTFVPELANSGTSLTLSSSTNTLHYTKIGQLVTINGRILVTSASGSSGAVRINNLPFVCISGTDAHGTLHAYGYNLDIPSTSPVSNGVIFLEITPNDNDAWFVTTRDDATWYNLEGGAFDSGSCYIHITGHYLTDS